MSFIIPKNYEPKLTVRETEAAIKLIKDKFEKSLAGKLGLSRISAPLFVFPETGLNDDLNGVERPVRFEVKGVGGREVEVVHSLAKWKRAALHKYNFTYGEGIYTDMNAIRRDEDLDNIHSIYVDQWDWEKILKKEERTQETLFETVRRIFSALKETEEMIAGPFPQLERFLPGEVTFASSTQLFETFPELTPVQREAEICRRHGAVFIYQIGHRLPNGERHDGRAPDYDDWSLNGDLLLWYPVLQSAVEISSMGVRVDEDSLVSQLKASDNMERLKMPYHQAVLNKEYPYTIGGGIGQSRLCLYFLNKAHIGEVQASIWPEEMAERCEQSNIHLL